MPLGKYVDFDACVQGHIQMGHSRESAQKICGAMERDIYGSSNNSKTNQYGVMSSEIAAFPPKDGEQKEEPKAEVSFNETELGVVTQFLTDAQDYLASDANAPAELKEEAGKAFEIVYSKVNVSEDAEPKPPA